MANALHNLNARKKKRKTVVVLKHTLRLSRLTLTSLWIVFSLSTLYFKLNFLCEFFWVFFFVSRCQCRLIHAQTIKKTLKNDSHFASREDRPSLSSLVSLSSQLPHSRHAFALSPLHETSTQRARKYYPRKNRYVPKITLEQTPA